jgi:hypothetical protein
VTRGDEDLVAMMWPMRIRLRSESDESMEGNLRALMISPKEPDAVGYAEVKRPEQSSPQVRRRYSSCAESV